MKVRIRSDSAGYEHELLRYCETKLNDRFGRIEFVIGCDVTPEFKQAVEDVAEDDWCSLYKEVDGKAGGQMPSDEFGANAAWWAIAILAMNLKLSRGHPAFETLVRMRLRIRELATGPPLPA